MALIKTDTAVIETAGIQTVAIKNNLISYIPRIISVLIFAMAVVVVTSVTGQIFDLLGSTTKMWDKIFSGVMFVFCIGLALSVAYAALRIVTLKEDEDDSLTVVRWALGVSAFFVALMTALQHSSIAALQRTGGSFSNPEARSEFASQLTRDANISVGVLIGIGLAYASLKLVDRRDVIIVRAGSTQKLTNISKDDADLIKNAITEA